MGDDKNNSRQHGRHAEELAADYLEAKGMEIVKTNFHFGKYGEIDIIARQNKTLVFVEVKARKSYEYGSPVESITPKKIKALRRAAEGYLYVNNISGVECRFDFIGIDQRKSPPAIEHLENAL
jgi:putative endonuclease